MRFLRKNCSNLKYALYTEKQAIYEKDGNGDIVYDTIDGEQIPRIVEYRSGFAEPVDFVGCLAFSGGESEASVFGVSVGDYDSKLSMPKGAIPIEETSIIFTESEPAYDTSGMVKESSADYRVVKIAPAGDMVSYLLKRIVHNG